MRKTLLLVAVLLISIVTTSLTAASDTFAQENISDKKNSAAIIPWTESVSTVHKKLSAKADMLNEKLGTNADISTEKILVLRENAEAIIKTMAEPLPHENLLSASTEQHGQDLQKFALEREQAADKAVKAWSDEVEAEKERIQKAEEQKQAEEVAARQAAETAATQNRLRAPTTAPAQQSAPTAEESVTAPAPTTYTPESDWERVQRIMSTLPFSFPSVSIGSCVTAHHAALACYITGQGIIVAPLGLTYGDCMMRVALAHEYRHHEQYISGQFQYDESGTLTNRDWLESDAYSFGYRYGC